MTFPAPLANNSITDSCPRCGSKNIGGVEYALTSEDYDGVSEWNCIDCRYRQGRWTGQELKDGFIEPRYGRGGQPVKDKKADNTENPAPEAP
jgi:hypothetical protein